MIFVGEGALLWRAVQHTLDSNLPVDLVCGPSPGAQTPRPDVPFRAVTDVNSVAAELVAASTDGVVWSLNNRMIFRAPVLTSGLRVLNIHHGPLPAYRGLPEVALVYAMLNGEREFAATLHQVDEGIDTGPTLAADRYPIGPDEPFHMVLRRGLGTCHRLFERCVPLVAADPAWAGEPTRPTPAGPGGYFGLKALARLPQHRDHPDFARATSLGFLADYLPELAAALR
ncbi:formyltransferase family protein [Streptomyces sp. NPDC057445]|uniref:formyltransferase family protein n=1 Tax=Streptomyces sp. NPDC057445 TaxID=3346136 RepID=UPI0036C91B69